jgi:hypothetical protein
MKTTTENNWRLKAYMAHSLMLITQNFLNYLYGLICVVYCVEYYIFID